MFQIFRRHQKLLLTSIALLAIGSMAFSAIAPLFLDDQQQKTTPKDLIKDQASAMLCLFNHSFDSSSKDIIFPKALFTKYCLETGLIKGVYQRHKMQVDLELEEVFQKIKNYKSVEVTKGNTLIDIFSQISPKMQELFKQMLSATHLNGAKKLELLCEFFEEKSKFPMALVYQYLKAISKNEVLASADDVHLFGLKNPEDFLGPTLVNQSAIYLTKIVNQEAKEKKSSMLIAEFGKELKNFYQAHVHPNQFFLSCGITPETGVEALKIFAGLDLLKEKIEDNLLLDPLSYQALNDFSSAQLPVDVYSFQDGLIPKTLEEALYLETYAKMNQVLKFDQYEIKIRTLDKTKAFQRVPKKKLYSKALSGYQELSELIPYALSQNLTTEKEKLEAIKNLQGSSKDLLEAHVQKIFLKEDPQFFQKILQETSAKSETIILAHGARLSPVLGFTSKEQLKKELDILPLNTPVVFEVGDSYLHEIELVSKVYDQSSMSYMQALSSGILKETLLKELEGTYKELLKKNTAELLNQSKKIKTLDEAFIQVAEYSAKDLKKRLSQVMGLSEDTPSELLVRAYPKLLLQDFQALKKEKDFRIVKESITLNRHEIHDESLKQLFKQPIGTLSSVIMRPNGQYGFYVKTQEAFKGEPVLDKTALQTLASEKLAHELDQRIQGL